jgi:hemerythrin-like domain-containing protein
MKNTANPAGETLRQAHVALRNELKGLEAAVCATEAAGSAELKIRLDAIRAHVTRHFRAEEEDGYMEAVRKREPHLGRVIDKLRDEHGELAGSLEELMQRARVSPRLDDAFREQVTTWIGRIRRHEASENELVQGAFNLDVAAED